MKKRDVEEIHRRIEQAELEGGICVADCRKGEVIKIHTEPVVYELVVVDPSFLMVEVTSVRDPDFTDTRVCRFMGCIWDNMKIVRWEDAPMGIFGFLLRNCYPVISLQGRLLVLPKIYQVELGGMPFFKNTT